MSANHRISSGYKQTEVGGIPEDWEVQNLGKVARVIGGGAFKSKDTTQTGVRWLKIANVGVNKILWDDESFLPEELAIAFNDFLLKEGSYVLALTRPVLGGKLKIAKIEESDAPALLNQRVGKIEGINSTDVQLLYYFFQKESTISAMQQSMAGTDPPNLSTKGIYSIACAIPKSLIEQRAIATALSDVDALLAAQDKLIAKKRDLKQAAMQQLLTGKQRLRKTGENGEWIVDRAGNPVFFSGEWEVKRLGDLLEYEQPTKYLVADSEYSDDNDVPVLTAGKTFILGYTDEEHGIFNNLPAIIFDDFTTANKYVTFPFKAKSSAMKILKPRDSSVNLRLVFEMMQLIKFKLGDHKRYWISEFQNLELTIPDAEEQLAIAAILSDMDTDLAALEQQRDKTHALKQGMMQELLTGRIRLI